MITANLGKTKAQFEPIALINCSMLNHFVALCYKEKAKGNISTEITIKLL